jgi:hypothetical protein
MTNTLSSVYSTVSTGITGVVDGWIGIGIAITLGLAAFALARKFVPQKKKVV